MSPTPHSAAYSRTYSSSRPSPPPSLLQSIFQHLPGDPQEVVDVGCGSGQMTKLLAKRSEKVIGLDKSKLQLMEASQEENIEYRIGCEEDFTGVKECSIDLVTVCQALHYMSPNALYEEAFRVLRPGGLLAIAGYHFSRPDKQELQEAFDKVYASLPHWSYPRHWVDSEYRTMAQPSHQLFFNITRENYHVVETPGSLAGWASYVSSLSGIRGFAQQNGEDEAKKLLNKMLERCLEVLGEKESDPRTVPVTLQTQYWLILYQKV